MRIKIKGEITAERLAEALQAATEKFEDARPGCKIYGANLYLTAYDADGLPFDLADHRGEPLWLSLSAKSGELVRPALSAEGEERRQKAKEEARKIEEEAEAKANAEYQKAMAKHAQEREARRAKEAEATSQFEWLNTTTAALLERDAEHFISALNEAVQAAWNQLKPIGTQGKKKGVPTPLPVFSLYEGGLLLSVETWKSPRRLLNPMVTFSNGELKPFWGNDAWENAMERMRSILDPIESPGQHLATID